MRRHHFFVGAQETFRGQNFDYEATRSALKNRYLCPIEPAKLVASK